MPISDTLIQQIKDRLDYEAIYGEFVRLTGQGRDRMALCVFHENTDTPALSVNIQNGLYKCFNPACAAHAGGDFIGFYMRVRDIPFPQAVAELARRAGVDMPDDAQSNEPGPISADVVTAFHDRLLSTASALTWLQEHRGLTIETVNAWQLGYDGQRYYIPIRDEANVVVNIRRYKPNAARAQDKMLSWRAGYGAARLWPYSSLHRARTTGAALLLCEGEMDCLLALQLGFCAITTTGGAGTWRSQWNELFRGLDVAICYDVDDAGRRGGLQVAHALRGIARRLRVVALPLTEPVGADITDYIHGHGQSADDLQRLIDATPEFAATPTTPETAAADATAEPTDVHLSLASRAEHFNHVIRTPVVLSGKTMAPYIVPKDLVLSCGMPDLPMCQRCPVAANQGRLTHSLDFESNEILQFVHVPDAQLQKQLKAKVGIPARCGYVDIEVEKSINVEEIQLIPEIDHTDLNVEYVTRLAYYIGHGLKTNKSYTMTGLTVPHPKTQLATHIITSKVDAQSNIDAFRMTADVADRLRVFQAEDDSADALWAKLGSIYDDLERHTRIYQRRDLMLAVDLTYHSLLRFAFLGDMLVRGWVECLVIGDTRTGKTTIVERLKNYYGAGEVGSGENTSLAGLIGGLHQLGDAWVLQWGKIPLNDRRLYAIDEAGNLPPEQIARLSSMRSSGIAEVIKVHTERTSSRTRQIWISNPRGNKPLSSYSQGVLAVKELIGAPEDIARFDLVVTAASDDVELGVINAEHRVLAPETYTADVCHDRVMWAWSRSDSQVEWSEAAEKRCLELATVHGRRYKYATEIPLVEPNEQRVKIARLAVAAAAMFFSTSDGANVRVGRQHVDFAVQFLDRLYEKKSLAFTAYAAAKQRQFELQDEDVILAAIRRAPDSVRQLMQQESLTQTDIAEILTLDDRSTTRETISMLRKNGFLSRQGGSNYVKTPAAIAFLRRIERDGLVEPVATATVDNDAEPDF